MTTETTTGWATENLARFDAVVAKGLARNQERATEQAAFLAACREWLAEQAEYIAPADAIKTFHAANPGLYSL